MARQLEITVAKLLVASAIDNLTEKVDRIIENKINDVMDGIKPSFISRLLGRTISPEEKRKIAEDEVYSWDCLGMTHAVADKNLEILNREIRLMDMYSSRKETHWIFSENVEKLVLRYADLDRVL